MKLTPMEILQLPTILIHMEAYDDEADVEEEQWNNVDEVIGIAGNYISPQAPHDILLAIPATHYMEYRPSSNTYTPRLYFTESPGGVLGANAMMGHDILFDVDNYRMFHHII